MCEQGEKLLAVVPNAEVHPHGDCGHRESQSSIFQPSLFYYFTLDMFLWHTC